MVDGYNDVDQYQDELSEAAADGSGCAETWETLSEKRSLSGLRRRTFLGAVGSAGATGLTGTAAATSKDTVRLRQKQSIASTTEAKSALSTELAKRILDQLIQSKVDTSNATRTNIFLDDVLMGYTINVPVGYGTLAVSYNPDGAVTSVGAELAGDDVPQGLRSKLSRGIRWPKSVSGTLMVDSVNHPAMFSRNVTESEIQQVRKLNGTEGDLIGMKGLVQVTNEESTAPITIPQNGGFIAASEGGIVVVNPSINHVIEETTLEDTLGMNNSGFSILTSCSEQVAICMIDVVMAVPHCGLTAVGCGFTGVGAVGCLVLWLSLCAPDLILIGLSGACTYVSVNCL